LLGGETGIVLSPIRMKPEHPSTTLPKAARIHFGRAYEVHHSVGVRPLGLIHAGSMETLISQFEEHCPRKESSNMNNRNTVEGRQAEEYSTPHGGEEPTREREQAQADSTVEPADMQIVLNMRQSIIDVLGPDLSLEKHPPPEDKLPQTVQLKGTGDDSTKTFA
jgi:hypothetical protein